MLFGGEEYFEGFGRSNSEAAAASGAFLDIDNRLSGRIHIYRLRAAITLTPGATGDALTRNESGFAQRLLYFLLFFFYHIQALPLFSLTSVIRR